MTTPPPEPTMPIPTGGEPTMPVPPGGGDATIPTQGETFGGGPGGPGGPGEDEFEEGDNRRLWLIAGGILVLGLIIGVIIAVAASGSDDGTPTTTTSSSTTSSSTTSTSTTTTTTPPTTAAPAPVITQFTVGQNPVSCPQTSQVSLSWVTQNTTGVTISIDNPNGPFGNFGPTDTQKVPFACGNGPGPVQHTYYLTANGAGGQTTQKQVTVTGNFSGTSSSSNLTVPTI
ncbi:MAG TPA: hypothetical protein VIH82_10545 [Acidimicrobiia bacterium]|jgi:hypothetical protein